MIVFLVFRVSTNKIIVLGFMGRMPIGGVIWQHIHYIVGLQSLGFDVYYVEDTGSLPYNPEIGSRTIDPSYAVNTLIRLSKQFGFKDRWCYCERHMEPVIYHGTSREHLLEWYAEAECALNVCGSHWIQEDMLTIRNLIYIQSDPGPEQIWVELDSKGFIEQFSLHHHLFTFGELVGTPHFRVPLNGLNWMPTRRLSIAHSGI
jgi:hypothetical protein